RLHSIYRQPVCIAREAVPRFLQTGLPMLEQYARVETELSLDLFTLDPGAPKFRLAVRGSPASLTATLYAEYGDDIVLVAGKADAAGQFALPDPADLMRYTVRNPAGEVRALERLAGTGFAGEAGDALTPIVGTREVLNFLGRGLPLLRRIGWKVEFEGRIQPFLENVESATPVVRIDDSDSGWFDVGFQYEDGAGQSLSEADIQRALLKGDAYLERAGRTILLDEEAITTARQVFADCASGEGRNPGTFRMDGVYSAYVKSSLDALDGIDVEAPASWRARAGTQNRAQKIEPEPLTGSLDSTLRPYQKDGVYWLRFLERNGFGGILADEMGLGKTLQMLAWVRLGRAHEDAKAKPVLIVCPTSLVENWAEEAARFVPDLRVLLWSGADRRGKHDEIGRADLVITSYALLRRDIEGLLACEFSAVVLDEAQHIKNRSTQNAVAVKKLQAIHRFVLTGTPIENSVLDLWSIMDFLMPGYLGGHKTFRENCEAPIAAGGAEAERAQARLRRKLHPFLLRRLKKDVARDLPPKIERLASCSLTRDQQLVYRQLMEASQRRLLDLVAAQGFERSRMEILKTLLRLRQACCHLDLLKLPDLRSEFPSAKMDLFFELLDEALDGGHRVLVFSQFTSMLAILRRELDARGLAYCYLDGATRERLKVVHEFNTRRDIPLFLISLKAGGAGLNLTGADMVIHFDPWWNPAVEDQATDRAHRIGQKNTVYSVKLITRGTVEEKVLAMQKKKKAVIDATLTQDEQVLQKLTWADVQELLAL
nr:SNF2 helicase associated domain-containing protein [Kiritimatiellia bacterium]